MQYPGLIAVAQKLIFTRPLDVGKQAAGFLKEMSGLLWLMAAMMSDAATETMALLRHLDTEQLDTVNMSLHIDKFIANVHWLFFDGGIYKCSGHTAFIIQWYETRTRHFLVEGESRCLGGVRFRSDDKKKCLEHMQAWFILAKECLKAEFPMFSALACCSAFFLPTEKPRTKESFFTGDVQQKLERLAKIFEKPKLIDEFKSMWHRAFLTYKKYNCQISVWTAWRLAILEYTGTSTTHSLLHVLLRVQTFVPATSKVEQCFSKIDKTLNSQRLHSSDAMEELSIDLILMQCDDSALDQLIEDAQRIWKECFPKTYTRNHLIKRSDVDVPRKIVPWKIVLPAG